MKIHFSRSMFKGIKNLLKHDGLGKQKGPKNHSNLNAGVHRKSIKKLMDLGVEIERNRDKTYPKSPFFAAAFFHRFWEGLGRVLEGFWKDFWWIFRIADHLLILILLKRDALLLGRPRIGHEWMGG